MHTSRTSFSRARTVARLASALSVAVLLAACSERTGSASASAATPPAAAGQVASAASMRVFKDAGCGCCKAWVEHMRQSGFQVTAIDEPPAALDSIKTSHGITEATASCHTAEIGGYVIEGHVPADLVQKLLREHPSDVRGLAVPGMVTGSPGMEGPDPQHYTVLALLADGTTRPYAER